MGMGVPMGMVPPGGMGMGAPMGMPGEAAGAGRAAALRAPRPARQQGAAPGACGRARGSRPPLAALHALNCTGCVVALAHHPTSPGYAGMPGAPMGAPPAPPPGAPPAAAAAGGGAGGKGADGKKKEDKGKMREAAGTRWFDKSLTDWPENDFRVRGVCEEGVGSGGVGRWFERGRAVVRQSSDRSLDGLARGRLPGGRFLEGLGGRGWVGLGGPWGWGPERLAAGPGCAAGREEVGR